MNITTESEMIDASKVRYLRSKTIIIVICNLIHDLFIIGKGYCIIIINAITDEIYLHHYCNFAGTKHIELHNEGILKFDQIQVYIFSAKCSVSTPMNGGVTILANNDAQFRAIYVYELTCTT